MKQVSENKAHIPSKLLPYAELLEKILESPEGVKPYIIYEPPDDSSEIPHHGFNMAMPTCFATSGVALTYQAMFNPQEYFFTEATMCAREFVGYLRLFADTIEERLPSASPVGGVG